MPALAWPWRRRAAPKSRWVVLDVEATGLDPLRDRLVAVAAVAVHGVGGAATPHLPIGDSFEVVVRPPDAVAVEGRAAILVHGIGVGEQRAGVAAAAAIAAFERWADGAPLLGFHAAFDRALLERAGLSSAHWSWLDVEPLAAVAAPDVRARALDDWLEAFGIECLDRHRAAADALATAQLLMRLWPGLRRVVDPADVAALQRLERQRRWLAV